MSEDILPKHRDWANPILDLLSEAGLFKYDLSFSQIVSECRGRFCYLATPYSKRAICEDGEFSPSASLECAVRAARCARALAVEGVTAVSPIIQAAEMVQADFLDQTIDPLDAAFWENWCAPMLRAADVVIVPDLDGWAHSDGIWTEVRAALITNRRVFLMSVAETFEGAA